MQTKTEKMPTLSGVVTAAAFSALPDVLPVANSMERMHICIRGAALNKEIRCCVRAGRPHTAKGVEVRVNGMRRPARTWRSCHDGVAGHVV